MALTLTDEKKKELEAKYRGAVHVVDKRQRWEVVMRKPTQAEYDLWKDRVNRSEAQATSILTRALIVYPEGAELKAMLDEYLGICDSAGVQSAVKDMLGLESEAEAK